MKAYRQFLKELPSKKVVFAFGRFQPPTIGHELLVRAVEHLASTHNASHVIYASRSQDKTKNPLPVDRKVYYLKRMFPSANFVAAGPSTRTFIEVAKELNKKYKDIIMVAGSDRVPEYTRILQQYNGKEFNFNTIQVVSAGERDPDSDDASGMSGTKMREAAKKGDFSLFKKGLPTTLTTADGRRLMNEIRQAMGLEAVKEQVTVTDWLRESYFRGEVFNVGQIVESNGEHYEILDRGSNYLTVVDSSGNTSRKWLHDVTLVEDYHEIDDTTVFSYKNYKPKNINHPQVIAAFTHLAQKPDADPVAILNALKATDEYYGVLNDAVDTDTITDEQVMQFDVAIQTAQEYLFKLGDLQHHVDYINHAIHDIDQVRAQYHQEKEEQMEESMKTYKDLMEMTFNSSDKIKVARIIADALGVANVEKSSSPDQLINTALRKIRTKPMRPEYLAVVKSMLQTADEAGIVYDKKLLPQKVEEGYDEVETSDTKLDKHGRKVHARKLRFKNAEKEDDLEEQLEVVDESMVDSWKKVQSMDKGSLTGGKDQAKKRLDYLNAVHAHHKKYGNDTKKVKGEIERINRSRIAEEEELDEAARMSAAVKLQRAFQREQHKSLSSRKRAEEVLKKAREDFANKQKQNESVKQPEDSPHQDDATDKLQIGSTGKVSYDRLKSFLGIQNMASPEALKRKSSFTHAQKKHMTEEVEEEEFDESEFDDEINSMCEPEHIIDAYDDEEFAIVDDETGEELDTSGFDDEKEEEAKLQENAIIILEISRMERIRRKQRFARTKSKREVRASIALKRSSNQATISKRARRLAVSMIKKRLLRKDPSKATLPEKERAEKFLQSRKQLVDRLARRVSPRIRQIEKARLQHKKYTK